jgi:FKBP-type peptidyl-prolyl cis-trans isomerase
MRSALLLLCAATISPSVSHADASVPKDPQKSGASFKPTTCGQETNKSTTVTLPDGLSYEELVVGKGALATRGAIVRIAYSHWQASGELIVRDIKVQLHLGADPSIPGLDEGVLGMRVGGKRRLHLPPELGHRSDVDGRFAAAPGGATVIEVMLEGIGSTPLRPTND